MDKIKIVVDAMGGDDAPGVVIDGAIQAINKLGDITVILVGDQDVIEKNLKQYKYNKDQIKIVHAPDVIENTESPVMAIRTKKDSSIVVGLRMVKEKEAHAFVSAGSTGAVLAGGTLIVGRLKGIERPALASFIPNNKGYTLLMDIGANMDCKPSYLAQFAKMGAIYYESFMGVKNPKIGLVNVGAEESKGNSLTKETFKLIKNDSDINFVGNIEAREITSGDADVIICDGFVGNVILKYTEGLAKTLLTMIKEAIMSSFISKIGGLLIKGAMKKLLLRFDYTEYGGAPLLGLDGLVVKTHGSTDANGVKNTILQCHKFYKEKVNEQIRQNIL